MIAEKDVYTAIEVLREFRDDVRAGKYLAWGLDDAPIATVKTLLENLAFGAYGVNRLIPDDPDEIDPQDIIEHMPITTI